jgi:hypothetical protein
VTVLALVLLAPPIALALLFAAAELERWAFGPIAPRDDDTRPPGDGETK